MAVEVCNICQYPKKVSRKDEDGRMITETIDCLGHQGIAPHLWNKHPDYPLFQAYSLAAARKRLGL